MKRRWIVTLLVVALVLVGVVFFYPTEEKRVWKVIVRAEEAVVNEDIDGFMEQISFNYSDGYGGSYLTVKKRVEAVFGRLDGIDIEKRLLTMSIDQGQAVVEVNARVTASGEEGRTYIIGDAAGWQTMRVYLEKPSFQWEIVRVEGVFDNGA